MKASKTLAIGVGILAGTAIWTGGATGSVPASETILVEEHFRGSSTIEGTFVASGVFSDSGTKTETFRTAGDTIHAVERLVSARGTITIEVQGRITPTGPTTLAVLGARWVVVDGTDAYDDLHGGGTVDIDVDLAAGTATNLHHGEVHFDPGDGS
jgi:hypothetical protein